MRHILQETSKLEKGWDGYGDAIPVNPAVITLIGKVLDTCRPDYLVEWMLAPNVNGTMLLEQDDAAISIAPRQFSFYAENGDNYIDGEGLESTVPVLINTIKKINLFMQE